MMAFLPPPMHAAPRAEQPTRRWVPALGFALALIASTVRHPQHEDGLSGPLRIVGARATAGPVAHWVAIFRREHPGVKVAAALPGGGVAAGAMASGLADVAPMGRILKPQERALLADAGMQPAGVRVDPRADLYLYTAALGRDRASPAALEFVRIALSPEGRSGVVPEPVPSPASGG
jgi:hypothetical protein